MLWYTYSVIVQDVKAIHNVQHWFRQGAMDSGEERLKALGYKQELKRGNLL